MVETKWAPFSATLVDKTVKKLCSRLFSKKVWKIISLVIWMLILRLIFGEGVRVCVCVCGGGGYLNCDSIVVKVASQRFLGQGLHKFIWEALKHPAGRGICSDAHAHAQRVVVHFCCHPVVVSGTTASLRPAVSWRGRARFSAVVLESRLSPATWTVSSCMPMQVPQMGKKSPALLACQHI